MSVIGKRSTHTSRTLTLLAIAVFLGCSLASPAANAPDAVMEWNQIAFTATVTAGQGPVPQIRTMAIGSPTTSSAASCSRASTESASFGVEADLQVGLHRQGCSSLA